MPSSSCNQSQSKYTCTIQQFLYPLLASLKFNFAMAQKTLVQHEGLYHYLSTSLWHFICFWSPECPATVTSRSSWFPYRTIADYIIVLRKSQEEHHRNLEALFQCLDAKGLKWNGDKCEYNQSGLWFYGCILSKDGPSADPKKVAAIVKTTTPENVGQLGSFLGLANYCARFV
jgi:hypothetical protein